MKRYALPALAWAALSVSPAFAASLGPLNTLTTTVVGWGADIGLLAFVGVCLMLLFAHEHFMAVIGHLSRQVVIIALLVGGATFLTALGISATGGAWLGR